MSNFFAKFSKGFSADESKVSIVASDLCDRYWEACKEAVFSDVRLQARNEVAYHASQREFLVYDHEVAAEVEQAASRAVSVSESERKIVVEKDGILFGNCNLLENRLRSIAEGWAILQDCLD